MRGERYLTRPEQFGLVYEKGRSWTDSLLVMKALPNGLEIARYGISVGKRVGKAVVRNRVKRLLREILRRESLRGGWDIIFIARTKTAPSRYSALEKSVQGLLNRADITVGEHEKACPRVD